MQTLGTEEYGDKHGFQIICRICGKEARLLPMHFCEMKTPTNFELKKITVEISCACGNKYGIAIHP